MFFFLTETNHIQSEAIWKKIMFLPLNAVLLTHQFSGVYLISVSYASYAKAFWSILLTLWKPCGPLQPYRKSWGIFFFHF